MSPIDREKALLYLYLSFSPLLAVVAIESEYDEVWRPLDSLLITFGVI